jgi:hypothetical protein
MPGTPIRKMPRLEFQRPKPIHKVFKDADDDVTALQIRISENPSASTTIPSNVPVLWATSDLWTSNLQIGPQIQKRSNESQLSTRSIVVGQSLQAWVLNARWFGSGHCDGSNFVNDEGKQLGFIKLGRQSCESIIVDHFRQCARVHELCRAKRRYPISIKGLNKTSALRPLARRRS